MNWPWRRQDGAAANTQPVKVSHSTILWVTIAFLVTMIITYVVIIWRLNALYPDRWCSLAKAGSPEVASGCIVILGKLVDVNGSVLDKMVILAGLLSLCLAVVALRINVRGGLPGGANIDIGADRTTISTAEGTTVAVPTPPNLDTAGRKPDAPHAPEEAPWSNQ
jgi:hypothetical protein